MKALCSLSLLLLPALVNAQNILPARFVPGDTTIGAAAGDQTAPAIARGGSQFLLAWQDTRNQIPGETATGLDIYAMRLDAAGNRLDAVPIVVTRGPADQTNPRISWNGQNWLVAWDTNYVGPTGYYTQAIQAARVSPAGAVLDRTPITVAKSTYQNLWAMSSDGTNWAVVYLGNDRGTDIWGTRISPSGQILDNPAVVVLPATYFLRFNLLMTYASGTYLFAWSDLDGLQALTLNSSLQPTRSTPIILATNNQGSLSLASNGSSFFYVYQQQQADFTNAVVGARMNLDGTVLDLAGINISRSSQPDVYSYKPECFWNGSSWLVDWSFGGLSVARVSTAGLVLDPGGRQVPGVASGPIALTNLGGIVLTYSDGLYSNLQPYDVKSVAISNTLIAGAPKTLSLGAPAHAYPDIAAGANGWMAIYRSTTSTTNRILVQPLNDLGMPATAQPIELESAPRLNGPDTPAIAWNGTYYMAVWYNLTRGGTVGMRLMPDGTKLDPTPILLMPGFSPDVAALGDDFLIVGIIPSTDPHFEYPYGVRFKGSTGQILDPSPILMGSSFALYPAVASMNGRWVLVYHESVSHDNPRGSIIATFLSAGGVVQGQVNVQSLLTQMGRGPQIAVNGAGTQALITYEDETISATETDIVVRRMNADGTFADPAGVPITALPGNQMRTAAAWNGNEYVVAWQDQRNRTSILDILDSRTDIFAARITQAGTLIDPAGFLVAATTGGDVYPIAGGKANGETIVGGIVPLGSPLDATRLAYNWYPAGNQWPVVKASATPPSGDLPLSVSFSPAGSSDSDGSLSFYSWNFGDGTSASDPTPVHTYATANDYVATLTVTDNAGAASSTAILVRATVVNQPPVAIATANKLSGPAPLDVIIDANGSFDPDGQLAMFHWVFSDGADYYGSVAYHTFSTPGPATVTLTIADDRGATASTTLTFDIGPINAPPVPMISATPVSGKVPLTVQFSSAGSSDPDGTITGYLWDFGDGTASNLANPSHVYSSTGTFYAHLTVTDNSGVSATSDNIGITAGTILTKMTCIGITMRGRAQGTGFAISGTATMTDSSSLALFGVSVTGEWTLPDGTKTTQVIQTRQTGAAVFSVTGPAGSYVLRIVDATKSGYIFDKAHSVLSGSITR